MLFTPPRCWLTLLITPTCCGRRGLRPGGRPMSWLFLVGLGIIWAACCFPRGMRSPRTTVQEFERGMDMLADVGIGHKDAGRFILAPRKGRPFLGARERARVRARIRRRRVLTFLLEAIALTGLMG